MSNTEPQQQNPWGIETLLGRFYDFVDSLSASRRKTYAFGWLAIAVVLIVIASLPLGDGLRWVSAVVGSPAGVIVFLLLSGLVHSTSLKNTSLFQFRQNTAPRKRVPAVAVGLVLVVVALISTTSFLPLGVGGTIVVVAALSAYNIIRRTPEEIQLAAQGLPDPREIEDK